MLMKTDLLQIIRQIDARLQDYMDDPFPEERDDMIVEFTEVVTEIQALIQPVVDDEDRT